MPRVPAFAGFQVRAACLRRRKPYRFRLPVPTCFLFAVSFN